MESEKESYISNPKPEPKMLQEHYRVRYLKLIAVFKILKGVFLLSLGVSLISLTRRTHWMDSISGWATDELLVVHSKTLHYLLNQLQKILIGGHLRATGLLSLFYSAVLFTEGLGVYFQKRWAEFLMIIATSALIPLEIHHLFVKPSVAAVIILVVNCFIVWFLYRVLRWERPGAHVPEQPELAKVG